MKEIIVAIKGYDGYYISNLGNVYCDLGKGNRDRTKKVKKYKLKPRKTKNGYLRVCIRENCTNKRKDLYIHRLVAMYFIPNPLNKKYVNHINCKRNDNVVTNLEWVTAKENTDYTFKNKHVLRNSKGQFMSNFKY